MLDIVHWLIIAYIINFILIITVVCFQRRDPVVSLAWVLGFMLIPIVGLIIFLVFGTGLKEHTKRKYQQKFVHDRSLLKLLKQQEHDFNLTDPDDYPYLDIPIYLSNVNSSLYFTNNNVKIYTEASDKYNDLLKDIESAKKYINMLYFIIRDDNISNKILNALTKKAQEGVEVRFLYDDFGSMLTPRKIFKPLKMAGGKVMPFFPVEFFGAYSKLNHRNHRKLAVIDGVIGYIGGMNIGDEYMGLKKPTPWRDTHLRIEGDSALMLQKHFTLDWEFSSNEKISTNIDKYFFKTKKNFGDVPIQIVSSGPDSKAEEIKCGMIRLINDARKYIYIQTPYFVPDKAFMTALTMAAEIGIDVRVMLPGIPDKQYVYYVTKSYIGELLDAGVKVYLYDGFLHSKTIAVDDAVSTIGTTNIDIRSFELHFEINAFIYHCETTKKCREIFLDDMKHCHEVSIDEYNNRGAWNVFKEGFFRLFSPIM